MPEVWVTVSRIVMGRHAAGQALMNLGMRYGQTGSSRRTPQLCSFSTSIAVNCLVTEASRKIVSGRRGMWFSSSASPGGETRQHLPTPQCQHRSGESVRGQTRQVRLHRRSGRITRRCR